MAMKNEYTPTIGLEIHAELKTDSKMFCNCKNDPHAAEPNIHICPICTAQPGSLPAVNIQAVENVLKVGVALGADTASFSEFDRKNYFYPDIPKAYQISQYKFPLVKGGELAGVQLNRIHLEEDTARSQHDQTAGSVVDYNRAGVPLMELVTEPVMHSAEEARHFAKELQLLLRTLGVSEANMEKGEMRVEANVSVSSTGELSKNYVEVKNINSFKAVVGAIEYEIRRQIELYEAGEEVCKETRGWDENKNATFSQRSKETAHDYRYFPDPDIPKYKINEINRLNNSRLSEIIPELPNKTRESWLALGLNEDLIEVLIVDRKLAAFFTQTAANLEGRESAAKLAANYISSDVVGLLQTESTEIHSGAPKALAEMVCMLDDAEINSRVAKDLLPQVLFSGASPKYLVEEKGLKQESSPEKLKELAQEIVNLNEKVVSDYRSGKETALKFLLGQGMKQTKGSANPKVLEEIFVELLSK